MYDPLREYFAAVKPKSFNENAFSIGMNFVYGPFTYYTAGDMQGIAHMPDKRRIDLESDMAKSVRRVEVAKMDHHGHEAMPKALIAKLHAKVYTAGVWEQRHLTKGTMARLSDKSLYPEERLFVPGILPSRRLKEDEGAPWIGMSEPTCAAGVHVVVDVQPGGTAYSVATVAASDESMRVMAVRQFMCG